MMNEQIQKFAEQAFLFASATDDSDESDANWWKEYNEKFAELIIRECMEVARQRPNPQGLNYKPSERFVEDLRQHFGVK